MGHHIAEQTNLLKGKVHKSNNCLDAMEERKTLVQMIDYPMH